MEKIINKQIPDKVYIFVSHSHYDIEKVRVIRNFLESLGSEPILFFLKSKDDEDEIVQLIKDEIDARIWFIYCKSLNAEASTWCKTENEHAALKGKWHITIDLDEAFDENGELKYPVKQSLLKVVDTFRLLQKIYVSYSHRMDRSIVELIANLLANYGIKIYIDRSINMSSNWAEQIERTIIDSDFYLALLNEDTLNTSFIYQELLFAKDAHIKAIPVYFEYGSSKKDLSNIEQMFESPCYRFDLNKLEKSSYELLEFLFRIKMKEFEKNTK